MTPQHLAKNLSLYQIIDVRDTDYIGRKIISSINIPSILPDSEIRKKLKGIEKPLVFHCQFSQIRGPKMAKKYNGFLLEGGFKQFYRIYPELTEEIKPSK